MSAYSADPRAEELQLLRQLSRMARNKHVRVISNHPATLDVAKRLEAKNEAVIFAWAFGPGVSPAWAIEIAAAGRRTMGIKPRANHANED